MSEAFSVTSDEHEEEWLRGGAAVTEIINGTTDSVSISTRTIPDRHRWEVMPPMALIKNANNTLLVLDLHKSRYITELHDSVCGMIALQKLILTHCHALKKLPENIGNLMSLEEVSAVLVFYVRTIMCLLRLARL